MGLGEQFDFGGRHASHQVSGFQLCRVVETGCSEHFGQGLECVAVEVEHPLGFVRDDQCTLAKGVLGGDTGGAFVGVAALGLNAT